ncbi:unnamed protein product [Cuscuta campestris]|uniref:Uncharacterized protein n=1 Tax=Cuscuta campestris TaxID=132261 RepID=A0A484MTV3_9ASTE|nr:unnamed protein product [Cuscuta campestris]
MLSKTRSHDASPTRVPHCCQADVHLVGSRPIERFGTWGRHRSLTESVYLSLAVLGDYGYAEDMEQLLHGTRWERLIMMRSESSLPLTIEFLFSLEVEPSFGSRTLNFRCIDSHTTLAFTLLGHVYCLRVGDLTRHLGLYTWEETMEQELHEKPLLFPNDVDRVAFWAEHSTDPDRFDVVSQARFWIQLTWRILSFVLSTSFFGRPLSTNRVYADDLIVFWSLHKSQLVNVAVFLLRFLYSQSLGNRTHIVFGFVVTLLFRSLVSAPLFCNPRCRFKNRRWTPSLPFAFFTTVRLQLRCSPDSFFFLSRSFPSLAAMIVSDSDSATPSSNSRQAGQLEVERSDRVRHAEGAVESFKSSPDFTVVAMERMEELTTAWLKTELGAQWMVKEGTKSFNCGLFHAQQVFHDRLAQLPKGFSLPDLGFPPPCRSLAEFNPSPYPDGGSSSASEEEEEEEVEGGQSDQNLGASLAMSKAGGPSGSAV